MGGGGVGSVDGVTGTGVGVDVGAEAGGVGSDDGVTGTAVGEADSMDGVAGAEVGIGDGIAVGEEGPADGVVSPDVGTRVAMGIGSREGVGEPAHPTASSAVMTTITHTRILGMKTLLRRVSFAWTTSMAPGACWHQPPLARDIDWMPISPGDHHHYPAAFSAQQERFPELISGNLVALLCYSEG